MKSESAICNLALQRIGVTIGIENLAQRSKEAIACSLIFAEIRDKVLTEAPWPFAKRLGTLNLSGDTPPTWKYRYAYPPNCLKVRRIFPQRKDGEDPSCLRRSVSAMQIPYELIGDDNDNVTLCTDLENAAVEYTARVTNPLRFAAKFSSAFAWALAVELALPLAKGVEYSQNAKKMYDLEINEAVASALNEEKRGPVPDSEFILARL